MAALGRAKVHFTGLGRRHLLIYLGAAAIIALTSADAFSNPGHKPVAPHQNKAVKAETGKHRAATDASHRSKAANAENHKHRVASDASHRNKKAKAEKGKHQSPAEPKHAERAPGPRVLLPSDPTNAGNSIPAPPLPPDLATLKQASPGPTAQV